MILTPSKRAHNKTHQFSSKIPSDSSSIRLITPPTRKANPPRRVHLKLSPSLHLQSSYCVQLESANFTRIQPNYRPQFYPNHIAIRRRIANTTSITWRSAITTSLLCHS
eukprot:205822_1